MNIRATIIMDRKTLRKLLSLSCFVNAILCLVIIHKGDIQPAYSSHAAQIVPLYREAVRRYPMEEKTLSRKNDTRTDFLLSRTRTAIKPAHSVKNRTSNQHETIKAEGSEPNKYYDPAFGVQHQTRRLPPRNVKELFRRAIPNMVYYVWCGEGRTFLYTHFISIYSIWYHLEPDVIEIHYEFPPLEDKYNTWLSWLRSNIPSFSLQPLPSHVTGSRCGTSFGLEIVADRGGIFIHNGVTLYSIARNGLHNILTSTRSLSFYQDGTLAWAAASAGDFVVKQFLSLPEAQQKSQNMFDLFQSQNQIFSGGNSLLDVYKCSKQGATELLKGNQNNTHYLLNNDKDVKCQELESNIRPIDILSSANDSIGRRIISVLYGIHDANKTEMEISHIAKNENLEIPNIVHYIWFGRKNVTLSMYLSFLSCVYVVQPDAILIHSDLRLYGKYWDLIVRDPNVHIVYREAPWHIYNHRILYTQHRSDIVRADVLDKYGGIYLDWDALWLKSPRKLLQSEVNDVILSRDHIPRLPFPDTINMGVVLAKPRSKFIRAWRAAWVNYKSDDFLYNAVELPYKIYELYPHTTLLHDRLQVMCYFLKCHPLFHPDHKHWGRSQPFEWTQDVYSIHFTHPDPPAFHNETALMSGQGMFVDIGRYIWNMSQKRD